METEKITEKGIRRVVWVPKKLDKEIEILRRKIGYTRSGFYRYALTRLLEQLLLSKRTKVQLRPWEEIIGTLQTIETNSQTVTAIISYTQNLEVALSYPKNTPEANIIEKLKPHLGQKIAILRTDNPEKRLIIRTINETTVAEKYGLPLWWLRKSILCVVFKDLRLIALKFSLWWLGLRGRRFVIARISILALFLI